MQTLQFEVRQTSPYVCRQCIDKLKKRRNLIKQTLEIEIFFNSKQEKNTEKESGNILTAAAKSSENTNARKSLRFSSSPVKEGTASRPDFPLSPVKSPLRKKKKTEEIQDNNRNEEDSGCDAGYSAGCLT